MFRALLTISGFTLLSRVAGFVRDMLAAALLGAGAVNDAFVVALRLPNLFRSLFAEGAFSAAFVPLFNSILKRDGAEEAHSFADLVLSMLVLVLLPFTILMILAMPWVIRAIAPGFSADPGKFMLAVAFGRVTFPYLFLISLTALQGAVLNSHDCFGPFAFSPILFNLTQILALLAVRYWGRDNGFVISGYAMSWAVTASGVLQALWLAISCRRMGIRLHFARPKSTPMVSRFFRQLGPGVIGAGAAQINVLAATMLASLLPSGAVSYLYYADRLNQLPLGVIGVAVGTALLPHLSRQIEAGNESEAQKAINRALEFTLAFSLPACVAFVAAGKPVIAVLFQHGRFTADATNATAAALAAYAVGLPAFVAVKSLSAVYFAHHDTKTPVRTALVSVTANILTALCLIGPLSYIGLALATPVAAWLNVTQLAFGLKKRGWIKIDAQLRHRAPRLAGAALGMGIAVCLAQWLLQAQLYSASLGRGIPALAALMAVGGIAYSGLAHILGALNLAEIRRLFRRS